MNKSLLIWGTYSILLAACSSLKKQTTATPPLTSAPNLVMLPTSPPPPGKEELAAIQVHFSDATQEQLTEGYSIYTEGACIKCHQAKNIYAYTETNWKGIIDDMARMANISAQEKEAVYRYVLSIKALEPQKELPASR
jgi:cytochrome c1